MLKFFSENSEVVLVVFMSIIMLIIQWVVNPSRHMIGKKKSNTFMISVRHSFAHISEQKHSAM